MVGTAMNEMGVGSKKTTCNRWMSDGKKSRFQHLRENEKE